MDEHGQVYFGDPQEIPAADAERFIDAKAKFEDIRDKLRATTVAPRIRVTTTYGTEEANRERWDAYQICKVRGHTASGMRQLTSPPKDVCKFCGTSFWETVEQHESNVPREPQIPPQREGDYL